MALALSFDLSALGAKGDNTTDDAAALQAAINAAPSGALLALPPAAYRVGSPLVFPKICHLRAWGATIRYTGSAGPAAVTFGDPLGGRLYGGSIEGLQIYKDPQDWTTGLIGILLKNVLEWECRALGVGQFPIGIQLLGDGQGNAYNRVGLRAIRDNGIGMQFVQANGGYVTESRIEGGDWYYLAGGVAGIHVQILGGGTGSPDNLRFLHCSFQAVDGQVAALDWQHAVNCTADHCRFETVNAAPMAVNWGAGTAFCSLVEPHPLHYAINNTGIQNFSWVKGKLI